MESFAIDNGLPFGGDFCDGLNPSLSLPITINLNPD